MHTYHHIQVFPPKGNRFARSFEDFASAVCDWPSMYFEMDGSFVWTLRQSNTSSPKDESLNNRSVGQIDGMVYDRAGHIEYVELKGSGPILCWMQLFQQLAPELADDNAGAMLEIVDCLTSRRYNLIDWPHS